jgi:hypothetical protein
LPATVQADQILTLGEAARRIGHGCRRWMVQRVFDRGLLPAPKRVGPYRIVRESDLPAIEQALRKCGYIKAK